MLRAGLLLGLAVAGCDAWAFPPQVTLRGLPGAPPLHQRDAAGPQQWRPRPSPSVGPRGRGARPAGPSMLWSDPTLVKERLKEIPSCVLPAADRLVVVGDVHGDADALARCLRIADLMDEEGRWCGGETHFVQLGDFLDRGDEEKRVWDMMMRLREEAQAVGGRVDVVLGNHELMNVELDFRYVTDDGWDDWGDLEDEDEFSFIEKQMEALCYPTFMAERICAFKPGGEITSKLADMPVVLQVGDTVLVHGGIRKVHVEFGLEELNRVTRQWMLDERVSKPVVLSNGESPVWTRVYSTPCPQEGSLAELSGVLAKLGASRMVVGHTPQAGINAATCKDGAEVWRVDTGMSKGMMDGEAECLEVLKDGSVSILTEAGRVPAAERRVSREEGKGLEMPLKYKGVLLEDICDMDRGICTPQFPSEEFDAGDAEGDAVLLEDSVFKM